MRRVFGSVEMAGIFGSERYRAIVAREHAKLDALLRQDPLRLRRLLPRRARQRLYDWRLGARARATPTPTAARDRASSDFTLGGHAGSRRALDLVAAVCRRT